jgi:hypothetical protein
MLSFEECEKILNENSNEYSNEQVSEIRDFLAMLAEIHVNNSKQISDERKSNYLH